MAFSTEPLSEDDYPEDVRIISAAPLEIVRSGQWVEGVAVPAVLGECGQETAHYALTTAHYKGSTRVCGCTYNFQRRGKTREGVWHEKDGAFCLGRCAVYGGIVC
jgi:hypothetical protein